MHNTEVVDIGKGEPSFHTPDHIKQAAYRAIEENFTKYTPQPGIPELREAIADKFRKENGIPVSPEEVVVSCGGKHSVDNAIRAIVEPGDEVILLTPHWFPNPEQVRLCGGRSVFVETRQEDGYLPDLDLIRSAVSPRTRLLIVNSPNNPTGTVYPRETIEAIGRLAAAHDFLILSDEVYEAIVFEGHFHVSIASLGEEIAQRTLTVNSVSKTHAMTGWRIGYAALPGNLSRRVVEIQQVSTSAPSAISQRAALAALTQDQSHVAAWREAYAERRAYVLGRIGETKPLSAFPPQGTFYCFVSIADLIGESILGRKIENGTDFANLLLEKVRVRLLSGEPFGSKDHVRVSFAVEMEALREGFDRIAELLDGS